MSAILLRNFFPQYIVNKKTTEEGLVGTDPELFVLDKNSKVIPAFRFLPSEKMRAGEAAPFADGFQTEFTPKPNYCIAYVVDNIRDRMQRLLEEATKVGGELSFTDVVSVPDINTYTDAEIALGCSPSMNAYAEKSVIPKNPRKVAFRTAGCHIHLGTLNSETDIDAYDPDSLVRFLDQVTGPLYTSLFEGLENPARRTMYGRAGEFRIKPYGIEYRTPAPASLVHPVVTNIVFDVAKRCVSLMLNAQMYTTTSEHQRTVFKNLVSQLNHTDQEARDVINNVNVGTAREMLKASEEFYENFLNFIYGGYSPSVWKFIQAGALSKVNPSDYKTYWRLNADDYWTGHGTTNSVANNQILYQ